MPLKIVDKVPGYYPMFICDHCNKPITDVRDGLFTWLGEDRVIFFTHRDGIHRRNCFADFERDHPEGDWLFDELPRFMVWLSNGSKMDWSAIPDGTRLWNSVEL